jgi:hypothetical protein
VGTTAPISLLSNSSTNIIGTDGNGVSPKSLTWSSIEQGFAAAIYNGGTLSSRNGLAVKVAGAAGTALDVSRGPATGAATPLLTVRNDGRVGIGTATPAHALDVDGTVQAKDGVVSPATGSHNLLPVAYGTVGSAGTLYGSTDNFTILNVGTGHYRISLLPGSGLNTADLTSATFIATLYGSAPGLLTFTAGTGAFDVYTFSAGGNAADRGFTFSVLQP